MTASSTPAQELIRTGRELVDLGLSPGASGNVSVRDGDRVLLSGTGTRLGRLTEEDLALTSLDGEHLGGARASKETPLHLGFYRRDERFRAVIHLHSPWAAAFSCTAPWAGHSAVPPLTPYFVMRVGQTPLLPYRPPGDPALGTDLEQAAGPFRAALLANHGPVVAGADLAEALERCIEVEEACRLALLTATADRRTLSDAQVTELATTWGSPWTPAPHGG